MFARGHLKSLGREPSPGFPPGVSACTRAPPRGPSTAHLHGFRHESPLGTETPRGDEVGLGWVNVTPSPAAWKPDKRRGGCGFGHLWWTVLVPLPCQPCQCLQTPLLTHACLTCAPRRPVFITVLSISSAGVLLPHFCLLTVEQSHRQCAKSIRSSDEFSRECAPPVPKCGWP